MLVCTKKPQDVDLADLSRPGESLRITNGGFIEMDIKTGTVSFHWWSLDHIPLHESVMLDTMDHGSEWDYFHVNSVDRTVDGKYLVSARYTNTIYLISGEDGRVIWRLGGKHSDFKMDFILQTARCPDS